MKAQRVVFRDKGKVELEAFEAASPSAGQVQVRLLYSVISPGTELAFLHMMPNAVTEFPTYAGYSASGRITAVGPDTDDCREGQLVAVPAGHGSHAVLDGAACWSVPEGLDPRDAAAFRLVSIALQGVRKAEIRPGQSVAVLGLGIIGNLAGQLVREAGATRVVGIDPVAWRRALAESCGFDTVCEGPEALGDAATDVVIEATGAPEAVNTAFGLAARLGRVILLGSTRGTTKEVNFCRDVHKKGLTVIGAHDSMRAAVEDQGALFTHRSDGRTALSMLAAGRVRVGPLLSDTVGPDQVVEAYARLGGRQEPLMTIAIRWSDD